MVCREWRVFGVEVPVSASRDVAVSYSTGLTISEPVLEALAKRLGIEAEQLRPEDVQLVRRSLDARPERKGGRARRASVSNCARPSLTLSVQRIPITDELHTSRCAQAVAAQRARERSGGHMWWT